MITVKTEVVSCVKLHVVYLNNTQLAVFDKFSDAWRKRCEIMGINLNRLK